MTKMSDQNTGIFKVGLYGRFANVLYANKFCCVCFVNAGDLFPLEEAVDVLNADVATHFSLKDIMTQLFNGSVSDILLSEYICTPCKDSALQAHGFIHQTKCRTNMCAYFMKALDSITTNLLQTDLSQKHDSEVIISIQLTQSAKLFEKKTNQRTLIKNKESNECSKKKYKCDKCDNTYHSYSSFKLHFKKKHDEDIEKKGITCRHCLYRPCMHEKYLLEYEKQKKMNEKRFKCADCDIRVLSLRNLIAHVNKTHFKMEPIVCGLCTEEFYLESHYNSHKKQAHEKSQLCRYCLCLFTIDILEKHKIDCQKTEKYIRCSKCPALFTNENTYDLHKQEHTPTEPMKPKSSEFKMQSAGKYKCPICTYSSYSKLTLHEHVRETHMQDSRHLCMPCLQVFQTRHLYLQHLKTPEHSKNTPLIGKQRYPCNLCEYSTNIEQLFMSHMNRYHLKIMPFKCDICGSRHLNKRSLQAHIKRHDETSKKRCHVCGKMNADLAKHMRLHTGERPYQCSLCPESFKCSSDRSLHVLKKHKGKSVPCPLCGKLWYTTAMMRMHVKKVHWRCKGNFEFRKMTLSRDVAEALRDKRKVNLSDD